ncbi:hypothetical protein AgCh_004381 [Apium graveolens]
MATTADYYPEIAVLPSTHDGLEFWQFMVAGSVASSVEHMAMFPIDTLKTRMQVMGSSSSTSYSAPVINLRQSLSSILRIEGPAGLYRGIAAMGIGAGPAHAVYFSVYETFKKSLLAYGSPNNSAVHAVSGVFATVASDAVITPMDVVKQRLQLKNSPYKAVHFAAYEAAKKGLMELSLDSVADEETLLVHATAGAAAGGLAAAVTTPLDVVKTRLQCQVIIVTTLGELHRVSVDVIGFLVIQLVQSIVKKDGYVGLMRGWVPRMLFHAPAAAICWSTYEAAKSFFQELNEKQA